MWVKFETSHPSVDLAGGHHCPHGAHRCAVYDLFYGRELGEISLSQTKEWNERVPIFLGTRQERMPLLL